MGETNHRRREQRLPDYDYRSAGAYYLTLCTYNRRHLFGVIKGERVRLSPFGYIVEHEWRRSEVIRSEVHLDEYIIMPNHMHAIVFLTGEADHELHVGATGRSPLRRSGPKPRSLGALIGGFKSSVTRRIRQLSKNSDITVWQRNYYERVIRHNTELKHIRRYIRTNPTRWQEDRLYASEQPPGPRRTRGRK